MPERRLTADQIVYIVTSLAHYKAYSEILNGFKERWPGVKLEAGNIQHYDPRYSPPPAKKWLDLHAETRKRFNEELDDEAMESRRWRQRARWKAAVKSAQQGNFGLLKDLIADGSKEATGGFGRRLELTGADGGPIKTEATVDVSELPTELLRQLADALKGGE